MLFNSFVFLIFGTLFFLIWRTLRQNNKSRLIALVVASAIFYGWWDWRFLFLLAANGLIVYYLAIWMEARPEWRKLFMALAIVVNLGCLFTFKYLAFFTENMNAFSAWLGLPADLPVISLGLPLGISFFTFECLSYVLDVYKGLMRPTHSLLKFFAFLSLFPHLIAGPIIRPYDLLPQLDEPQHPTDAQRWEGFRLIVYGFFKKVFIADNLAPFVNEAFAKATVEPSMPYWWVIMSMFAFQIYCDFSGYSDIARGLAKWMGYEFNLNFNNPYISRSLREFWGRWHITLSTWFRDYVYIALGGARKGVAAGILFMWVTMLVSGFWHGAAWTFIVWGGLHAFYLMVERLTDWPKRLEKIWGLRHVAVLLVLVQVWVAWVFFRAVSMPQALEIVRTMFDFSRWNAGLLPQIQTPFLAILGFALLWELYYYLKARQVRWVPVALVQRAEMLIMALMITASVYFRGPGGAFVYFQF